MKISVVTIVFNDVNGIGTTVDSVASQTARNDIEYIVIDGASSDGTADYLMGRSSSIDIYVSEPDKGIYDAMNKGLERATGDFVIFMNSGDRFSSADVVERMIEQIEKSPAMPAVAYGNYRESRDGVPTAPIPSRRPDKIWYGPVASHQSTFYNLSILRELWLKYDLNYRIAADYKLTLSVLTLSQNNGLQTDICVSDFDVTGLSNKNQNQGLKEANRARREVLHWGRFKTGLLTTALYGARYMKRFMRPVYNLIRRH